MTNSMTRKIAAALTASVFVGIAGTASAADDFSKVPNAGIPGYNQETLANVSVQACLQSCSQRGWCKSADYERATGKCFLQPVNQYQKSLRKNYPGNPYDHYHRSEQIVEIEATRTPKKTERRAASTGTRTAGTGQCGKRVSVTGVPATGLVYNLKKNRAERRAKRAWRGYVAGENGPSVFSSFTSPNHASYGLGTRYADLGKARNVVINCQGGGKMHCTVTATPCAW